MKNAPITISNESALDKCDYTDAHLPKRVDTVTAEVLAELLESKALTGMESVFKQSTTRLSAFIHYLKKNYNFHSETNSKATGTNDGRISTISAYWFAQAAIEFAFENLNARDWIFKVRAARKELRKQAPKCKVEAAQKNARKYPVADPRQCNLWGEI
jgi:hypothetical protein